MTGASLVHLVGAGPGDPGLLTVRARELIAAADAILYDRLIPPGALDGARDDAELIDVGKRPGVPGMTQEEINELLVAVAHRARRVVRLKGGDPFLFGRGGEEAEALRAAGVPFEIVPGVTAGIAAPAYAGIPVTHRDRASAVAFVTGHEDPDKPSSALDWDALARFPGTLVFYMGIKQLPRITASLIAAGRDQTQPAAVVERGTLPGQRTVLATLSDISERAAEAELRPPSITVIGPVAALHEALAWVEARPLHGRSIAVTRARAQASGLATRLRELGANVLETPAIRIDPLPVELPELGAYDLICLTSPNGARLLFECLHADGRDARALAGATIAAIGPGTAAALREHGVLADVVPQRFVAEGLIEALSDVPAERVLIARAREARDTLPDALRARGAHVDVLALYATVAEALDDGTHEALGEVDYVTFTSSSTVRFLLEATGGPGAIAGARIASIGPITSATLREHGLEPAVEAERHDIDGLVDALLADTRR